MSFLTGKPQSSSSKNLAYPEINQDFGGWAAPATGAVGQMADLLGVGPNGGGFQSYLGKSGYDWVRDQGSKAITGNNAARGLLNSGSTLKALDTYGQNLGNTYLGNYLGQLGDLSKLGLGAGNLITQAGQVSKGTGATQGLGQIIGSALATAAIA